jgi:hypothetical protein
VSYYATTAMASNTALRNRIVSAVAMEGEPDPFAWMTSNIFTIASHSDWVEKWDYAEDTKTVNVNPDTGQRDDVIDDAMILTAVQAIRGT